MKNISIVLICFLCLSCKSIKFEETPKCPKNYICNTELLSHKSIKLSDDSIGKIYPKFEDDKNFHVIKYTYQYKGQPQIADDTYLEAIYFQIPQDTKNLKLSNKQLSEAKLIAQKSCFCRDAGYELVKIGHLNIEKQKDTYYIDIQYESSRNMEVNNLQTTVKLKG